MSLTTWDTDTRRDAATAAVAVAVALTPKTSGFRRYMYGCRGGCVACVEYYAFIPGGKYTKTRNVTYHPTTESQPGR